MALYPQLLLRRGGGIVSDTSKADQAENGATIVIGLGGTGVDCLKNFKRQVYNRIKADNHNSKVEAIPEYKHIKFLAIDTAADSIKSDDKDVSESFDSIEKSEFLKISVNDIVAALGAHAMLNRDKSMAWLAHEAEGDQPALAIKDMKDGAGGIRQAGRFAIIYKARDVITRLNALITQATSDRHNKLSIHIFAGIGGGTGSGAFLDICYITKMLLAQNALLGSTTVCGYFFMPDVNLSIPSINSDKLLREQITRNGYAALKELDYCMNLESNGGEWEQIYDGNRYSTQLQPVDLCHLISSKTIEGAHSDNSYEYALNVVSDYVLEFTADQGGRFGMDQHRANVAGQVTMIKGDTGANYTYGVIGASCAAVPYREINTYLATRLFEQFHSIYDVTPSDASVQDLAEGSGLVFNSLFREYTKGANIDGYLGIANSMPLKELKRDINPLITAFNNYDDKILGVQQENGKQLSQSLGDNYDPRQTSDKSASVISRIFNMLYRNVLCNPKNGPFYAANALNGLNNKSLLNILEGLITTNNEKYLHYNRVTGEWDEKKEIAKSAYQHRQNSGNTRNYVDALVNFYTNRGYSIAYNRFASILSDIKTQISSLSTEYFTRLCRVLKNLKDTFKENDAEIKTMIAKDNFDDDYVRPIMTIAELKPFMDETLKKTEIDNVLSKMITSMADNPELWMSEDPFKISRFVNDFLANDVFDAFANQSILDFLKMKFNETDPQRIEKELEETKITELESFSKALFWMNPNYNIDNTSTIEYISVPANSTSLVNAATQFKNNNPGSRLTVRPGNLSDRISFMKFYCGVPMYAYMGIEEYERVYSGHIKSGTHLFERGVDPTKHWETYLPTPIPKSFDRVSDNPRSEKYYDNAMELYKEAIEENIAIYDEDKSALIIRTYDYSDVLAGCKKIEDFNKKGRIADSKKACDGTAQKLKTKESLPVTGEFVITGSDKGIHIVEDKFILYPHYRDIVSAELKICKKVQKKLEEVTPSSTDDYDTFRDAYFVGQISFKPLFSVKLIVEDEFGFKEEYVLCDAKSSLKTIPVYQAYKSFCELSDDIKKTVQAKNEEILAFEDEDTTTKVVENIKVVYEKFNPDYINALQDASKASDDPVNAISFLKKFVPDLATFYKMISTSF